MKEIVRKKIKKENSQLKKYRFEAGYKLVYVTVFLFFSGLFLSTLYGFKTIIPLSSLLQVLGICIVSAYLIQIVFFRTVFPMKKMEYLMVSVIGLGPILTALFLMANYYIHSGERTIRTRIEDIKYAYPYQYFLSNDLPCEDYPELCVVHIDDVELKNGRYVVVFIARGVGGFEVITHVRHADE